MLFNVTYLFNVKQYRRLKVKYFNLISVKYVMNIFGCKGNTFNDQNYLKIDSH